VSLEPRGRQPDTGALRQAEFHFEIIAEDGVAIIGTALGYAEAGFFLQGAGLREMVYRPEENFVKAGLTAPI
jgi:hypothetical protein